MPSSARIAAAVLLCAHVACTACSGARAVPGGGGAVAVTVAPASALTTPRATVSFTASVSGTANAGVTWAVAEPGGGTIDGSGLYTAPAEVGTYHVVATSVADPAASGTAQVVVQGGGGGSDVLPQDRLTVWKPGVAGGIPARATVCAALDAATWGNGGQDATAGIQAAIDACPEGQVVRLSAGAFTVNGGGYLLIRKGITLRGAGADQTTLQKTDGAKPGQEGTGPLPTPIVVIGPTRYGAEIASSVNLAADAAKGSYSVEVASASGLAAGQLVLLDEASGAAWQDDPARRGKIWASPDWRVVWQKHDPALGTDDFDASQFPSTPGSAGEWFSRLDRPTSEVKQIASVGGNTVTFTTPVHISYRAGAPHSAQLTRFASVVRNAGVESLKVIGGDNGNIRFESAANCWARNVENTVWHDEGFAVDGSFRVEIRDSYVHDAAWAQPGGAGYALSFAGGSSECLVENSIILKANKVMVARSSGAGSVVGYNYVDDGYINTNPAWIESGLNGSHMVGPHHMLFEGNYGFNADSDKTHGNSVYHTFFRNHLRGVRATTTAFGDTPGSTVTIDDSPSGNGPKRCAGLGYYSYWHSFVGNVLGAAGQMTGWSYEGSFRNDSPGVWLLGWDDWDPYPVDAMVAATTFRHGNWDFVTNSVAHWEAGYSRALPDSLYLAGKPAFFGASPWPWVDPSTGTTYALPARARYDAGTPNLVP